MKRRFEEWISTVCSVSYTSIREGLIWHWVPKLNLHVEFSEVHITSDHSHDDTWHFSPQKWLNCCQIWPWHRVLSCVSKSTTCSAQALFYCSKIGSFDNVMIPPELCAVQFSCHADWQTPRSDWSQHKLTQ